MSTLAPPKKPRIFYGWYIVGASVLTSAYCSLSFFQGFTVFFLPILKDLGWSRTLLSGAFSLRQLESGIASPFIGWLVDKIGGRKVILASVVVAGAGIILISYSRSVWMFYLTFVIASAGVGGASHGISWVVVVAKWFRRKRGLATGLAMMGGALGGPALVLVSLMEGAWGWRAAALWLGIGFWVFGIPLALVARSKPQDYGYLPDGDPPPSQAAPVAAPANTRAHEPHAASTISITLKEALRGRAFWTLTFILGAQQISMGALQVHQIAYFEDIGFSRTQAATTVAVAFTVSAIGRLSAGALMDLFDWRRVLAVIFAGQVVAFLILVNVTSYWHAMLFAVVVGVFQGASVPARPVLVGTVFGTSGFGTIWGFIDGAITLVGVLGPLFLGWVFDTRGSYVPGLLILAGVAAAAVPLIFLTPRTLAQAARPV